MTELSVDQLIDELLAWAHDEPLPERDEDPLCRWQRWMRHAPDDAWLVLEGLVNRAPQDPELMERASRQAALLVSYNFRRFSPKLASLLAVSPLLNQMIGPEIFVERHFGPRYRTLDELASVWVLHQHFSRLHHDLMDLVRDDHPKGLRVALEIIDRGPLHGFDTEDVDQPLLELLQSHGPLVIGEIEEAARQSEAVRRAIWSVRRFNPRQVRAVPADLWERFQRAAGATTTYTSALPPGTYTDLGPELEGLLSHWFMAEETFWSVFAVDRILREDPGKAWDLILSLIDHADSAQCRCDVGCGPLEDLLRRVGRDPAWFIERVEAEAQHSPALRDALGCVWLTFEDVPEALARRYYIASGRQLRVLDAPPGWHNGA